MSSEMLYLRRRVCSISSRQTGPNFSPDMSSESGGFRVLWDIYMFIFVFFWTHDFFLGLKGHFENINFVHTLLKYGRNDVPNCQPIFLMQYDIMK